MSGCSPRGRKRDSFLARSASMVSIACRRAIQSVGAHGGNEKQGTEMETWRTNTGRGGDQRWIVIRDVAGRKAMEDE